MLTAPYVLFRDDTTGSVTLFTDPEEMIVAHEAEEFFPALARMQAARAAGKYLAGYMSYEAGYLFEKKLAPLAGAKRDVPLLCFGVFTSPAGDVKQASPGPLISADDFLSDIRPGWTLEDYRKQFSKLHQHLRQGDCYQANLTMPVHARWNGDPLTAFWSLIDRQPVKYGALVNLGGPVILSRSPELFFAVQDGWIETHPMKGTIKRGASPAQDAALVAGMLKDEKTLAENRMIVDLLRNDISRIGEVGTLDVPKLFEIETYPTVHQMVSHVRAKLLPDMTVEDVFAALFPCGSVTGAPKMRAMEILHDLEIGPRNVYCGAIGMISPGGDMRFSVAIRTITLFEGGRATFNVGGGIVFDSTADAEYDECLLKAKFATGEKRLV
ncbi:aminodeoxychorismate synthase component I [Agrobacterium rosae]|uniref:Aminodeoxychorismate synthase component I n=1 Tax=Agrobacterium rosae TaxID=1972867 RepID=A0AAE5VQH5_9HYPH|nr:aminodeoxychorismate synthase component I [Agrobacterium rosae]KAA3512064.1 aminodeoxychorismate synthase component I [Agrobacterium rosae]KAA3520487.1 aminodeoxychorismate synthase component I [Agrobacterium rosae]MCM2432394.1 aminodeoxychorismate synthase component I [Agrobacterium rosae]MDX8331239.1 aminodeoxychorismate synthase component I [Agrobacterium rosae]MQB48652.1 aminodeoxychorismate synthase component I [Agrobacterium rosae]